MAKSTKGARNIVVDGVRYRWRATGNDGWISLVIWPDELPGATITSTCGYDQTEVPMGDGRWRLTKQVVITNRIVLRVILHSTGKLGYDPRIKAAQLNLGPMEGIIDMNDALRSK